MYAVYGLWRLSSSRLGSIVAQARRDYYINRLFFKIHNPNATSNEITYKVYNPNAPDGRYLYFFSDAPHLIKTVRMPGKARTALSGYVNVKQCISHISYLFHYCSVMEKTSAGDI